MCEKQKPNKPNVVTIPLQGLLVGQLGTTLVDLQIVTGTDLGRASAFITGATVGYMSGAFFSGAVFDKVNY